MKFISTLIACAPAVSALWPIPKTYTHGDSVLFIQEQTPVTYNGKQYVCGVEAIDLDVPD